MGKLLHGIKLTATLLFVSIGLLVAAVSLPFTGWKALSVQTGSMKPAISPGTLVLVHSTSLDSLKKGDVITYKSKVNPGITVTHRIVERTGNANGPKTTITQGDANKTADAPISDLQIVGKVVGSVPLAGKLLDALKTPVGLALLVYLPIILIFVSEIRLLVRRLTALEMQKQQAAQPAAATSATTAPATPLQLPADRQERPRQRPQSTPHPSAQAKKHPRKLIGGMGVMLVGILATSLVAPTFANLEAEAALSNNVISVANTPPPEDFRARVLLDRIAFGKTLRGRYNNRGPVTWYTQPAVITLYGNSNWQDLDTRGWTLESNMGIVYRFQGAKWRHWDNRTMALSLGRYTSPRTAGDFMVIKDRRGRIVDSLSWGTNTTQFNPALPAVQGGDRLERLIHADTDSSADWRRITP